MKTILVSSIISQYDAINLFLKETTAAFSEKGFDIVYMDKDVEKAGKLKQEDIAFAFCFNGVIFSNEEFRDICEQSDIPVLSFFVDAPETHMKRILNSTSNSVLTFVDSNHVNYLMRHLDFNNTSRFLPHGGSFSREFKYKNQFMDRPIDIIFIGTYMPESGFIDNFVKLYGEGDLDTVIELSEYLKTDYGINFHKLLDNLLTSNGVKRKSPEYRDLFVKYSKAYDIYRCHYRNETIRVLLEAGLKITCYGNHWEKSGFIENENFIYKGACNIDESVDLMAQAKVALNIVPSLKNGSHERIFSAMLNGCVCVSTKTDVYGKLIKDMENIVFYDLNDRKKMIDDIKEVLGNEDGFKKITSIAYETSRNNFLWEHRVEDMLDIMKDHCRI